ncbi:uncharacterized protein LOC141595615 [Silene latifolia]|uniref:uncharacterized protein LOC141595615 n=1 Tax=Silene latifolia TaxID=37657 RepID=UPI003D778B98
MLSRVPELTSALEKAGPDSYDDSLFVDTISVVAMPKRFTNPSMPLFDVMTDPFDHMSQYKQKMMTVTVVGQVKEACMCKGFGSTLSGPTLRWFVSLPNRSISTFADLVNAFTQQFASSRKPQKHPGDLSGVQGASEIIGEYNTRFNNEKVAVRECDVSTIVEAFRRVLHHESDLYKQLTMHPCHSFEAVQQKAAAAIRLEEGIQARASMPSTPIVSSTSAIEKSGRKQPTSKKDKRYRPYGMGVNNREENQQLPTLADYGFTIGVGGILKALREIGDGVRWPRPPVEGQVWRKDSKKKCEFHRDIGHNTEDCYTLRREIRRLYEQGELSHLLPPKRRASETKGDRPETSCRISHNDLPAVAFDEGDVHDGQEHHDALIITLSMANCTVRKVLVDTGSSVNLIMLKTIENMGFSEKDLQKKIIPLVGFSGQTTNSLGEIVIPTYVGGVNK